MKCKTEQNLQETESNGANQRENPHAELRNPQKNINLHLQGSVSEKEVR